MKKKPLDKIEVERFKTFIYEKLLSGQTTKMIVDSLVSTDPDRGRKYFNKLIYLTRLKIKEDIDKQNSTMTSDFLTRLDYIYEEAYTSGDYKLALSVIKEASNILQLGKQDKVDINIKQEQNHDSEESKTS